MSTTARLHAGTGRRPLRPPPATGRRRRYWLDQLTGWAFVLPATALVVGLASSRLAGRS